jgi:hypothetical protein
MTIEQINCRLRKLIGLQVVVESNDALVRVSKINGALTAVVYKINNIELYMEVPLSDNTDVTEGSWYTSITIIKESYEHGNNTLKVRELCEPWKPSGIFDGLVPLSAQWKSTERLTFPSIRGIIIREEYGLAVEFEENKLRNYIAYDKVSLYEDSVGKTVRGVKINVLRQYRHSHPLDYKYKILTPSKSKEEIYRIEEILNIED